jgi:hypothetical protein
MKILKYFGIIFFLIIGLFLVLINFSSRDSRFKCTGNITVENKSPKAASIYIKLEKYRWWVGLWSDSDGSLWLEVPNSWSDYYNRIVDSGENLIIYDTYEKKLKGNFSMLSKTIAIETTVGYFVGTCEPTSK